MEEMNAGYKVIEAETYTTDNCGKQARIVLGQKMTTHGAMFVTWESVAYPQDNGSYRIEYFWGHYFDDGRAAFADYYRRLLEKYE